MQTDKLILPSAGDIQMLEALAREKFSPLYAADESRSLSRSSRVGCYREALAEAEVRLDVECLDECDRALGREIHRIIAEMSMLPENTDVRIDGLQIPAGVVSEVYSELKVEHLRSVIRKFGEISYEIKFRKTYLRAALYNEVFEHASQEVNELARLGFTPKRTY